MNEGLSSKGTETILNKKIRLAVSRKTAGEGGKYEI
jgi:ribosomal protein L31E